ncbi:MAG: hypothetical protein NT113_18970 [Hyphomicrobiales bacterium]|jgi:hypothetical protein|nr:hypothetical protein [Hyphomicrobiales bacterium]
MVEPLPVGKYAADCELRHPRDGAEITVAVKFPVNVGALISLRFAACFPAAKMIIPRLGGAV